MSELEFFPAQGEQLSYVFKRGLKYNGFDMTYWTDQAHFKYPRMLQSVYYAKNGVAKGENFRTLMKYPKENTLISDSGGFQIASFKKRGEVCNLSPLDSLRVQEEYADIGMNLDIPPNLDGVQVYGDFIAALKESVKNFQLFETKRENYDMKLYNVLHGETYSLLDTWYKKVKDFNFDGWAVGIKPPFSPMLQAQGFLYLYEKGEFDKSSCYGLHFFGTSGKHVCPTLAYAVNKIKPRASFDSSSFNIGSLFRTYYQPLGLSPHISFGEKFKELNPNLKTLPCMCPVCQSIKDIEDLNSTDIFGGTLISLHNMYQYIQYTKVLNSLVKEKDIFMDFLIKFGTTEKTLKSIEFIDFGIENGLKAAIQKYSQWLKPQALDKTRQRGIFDY